jgi:hypothetical protein
MKDDHTIEPVHEFGRKSAPSGFDGSAFEFHVQTGRCLCGWFHESHRFAYQSGYFARAEIRGENDNRLREIDATCIAKRQGGFVQDAEQQLPQGVAGLFYFVEEHEAESELIGVVLAERLFGDEWVSIPVTQVAWRRTYEFGNLVGVLKLRTAILTTAFLSPNRTSAAASTMRVFPEPVGPKKSKLPTGRPGACMPAQKT